MAKTKALISCVVTAQLICTFVFTYADCLFSYVAAHFVYEVRDAGLLVGANSEADLNLSRVMRKTEFCLCENKDADQL